MITRPRSKMIGLVKSKLYAYEGLNWETVISRIQCLVIKLKIYGIMINNLALLFFFISTVEMLVVVKDNSF